MQGIASSFHESAATARPAADHTVAGSNSAYQGYQILRRNGAVVAFEPSKIAVALMKAFLAVHGTQGAASASAAAHARPSRSARRRSRARSPRPHPACRARRGRPSSARRRSCSARRRPPRRCGAGSGSPGRPSCYLPRYGRQRAARRRRIRGRMRQFLACCPSCWNFDRFGGRFFFVAARMAARVSSRQHRLRHAKRRPDPRGADREGRLCVVPHRPCGPLSTTLIPDGARAVRGLRRHQRARRGKWALERLV